VFNRNLSVRIKLENEIEGEFVYAVTAAEGVILSLFTSNEQ